MILRKQELLVSAFVSFLCFYTCLIETRKCFRKTSLSIFAVGLGAAASKLRDKTINLSDLGHCRDGENRRYW